MCYKGFVNAGFVLGFWLHDFSKYEVVFFNCRRASRHDFNCVAFTPFSDSHQVFRNYDEVSSLLSFFKRGFVFHLDFSRDFECCQY